VASAGSLINRLGKWFRGDHLESEPTNQTTNEVLKPYRYCPIIQFLAQARTGKTKSDVRRAKSQERELRAMKINKKEGARRKYFSILK